MGLIINLMRDPKYWQIENIVGSLKTTGESVSEILVGSWNDSISQGNLTVYMRDNTFNKLQRSCYTLVNVTPYAPKIFDILDENGELVPHILIDEYKYIY